ncbi:MAG TPA: hypothetical protein VMD59_14320, partial [Acidimicrobiales bacterium]|nr:hypothetical protein [Acidimicrobiales bacterium]
MPSAAAGADSCARRRAGLVRIGGGLALAAGSLTLSVTGTAATPASSPMAATWSASDLGPSTFTALACATPARCVATGPAGWEARSSDGGREWSVRIAPSLGGATIARIVCPTEMRCVAVGSISSPSLPDATYVPAGAATAVAFESTNAGVSWQRAAITGNALQFLDGLSCPSAEVCYATAASVSSPGSAFLVESDDGGSSWTVRLSPPRSGLRSGALSCPAVGHCFVDA